MDGWQVATQLVLEFKPQIPILIKKVFKKLWVIIC